MRSCHISRLQPSNLRKRSSLHRGLHFNGMKKNYIYEHSGFTFTALSGIELGGNRAIGRMSRLFKAQTRDLTSEVFMI